MSEQEQISTARALIAANKTISQREISRKLKVDMATVSKWVEAGRIVISPTKKRSDGEMSNINQVYLSTRDVMDRYHIGRTTIHNWVSGRVNGFPKPFKLGMKDNVWRLSELEEWEDSRRRAA